MIEPLPPDPDAFDEPLLQADGPRCDDRLRQALLGQTTRLLRRRRRRRRLLLVAALAACYLAGLLTMQLAERQRHDGGTTGPGDQGTQPATAQASKETERGPEPPPVVLEQQALAGTERKEELYRHAADRYLTEDNDAESALRCYRRSLDAGTDKDLIIAAEDSYLLMALKRERQKERTHVENPD